MVDVSSAKQHFREHARLSMERARIDITADTQQAAPRRTTKLAQSIVSRSVETTSSGFIFTIVAGEVYAAAVDSGARPHIILPKTASVLMWHGPDGKVFRPRVNHPGFAGRHFFREPMPKRFRTFLESALAVTP